MRKAGDLIRAARRAALFLALVPLAAAGQVFERPADERPELPPFEAPEAERTPVLPSIPPPVRPEEPAPEPSGPAVFVREIRIEGSTVFSPEQLAEIAAPYTGRIVRSDELVALRRALTLLYVEQGYVSSGAVIPPQDLASGMLRIDIVEGALTAIQISGNRRLRTRYLEDRIRRSARIPLNVNDLEERLQLLQLDPMIGALRAQLSPGEAPGESVLRVEVLEHRPYRAWADVNNNQPPSLGSVAGDFAGSYRSATGFNDFLDTRFTFAAGLIRLRGSYQIPVNRYDTELGVRGELSLSELVDSLGRALEVEANAYTIDLFARQPIYRSRRSEVALELRAAYRRSETKVLGEPFSFVPGPDRGVSTVAVLRFVQSWTYRTLEEVVAARSTLSVGLPVLGATVNPGPVPDGRYAAWLAQLLWARRLPWLGMESVFRTDLQVASDPLLPLEQIGVGGAASVRGYRENVFVRDQAVISSIELRIPVLRFPRLATQVSLAPFFDYAHSWNKDRPTLGRRDLASPGIGLRVDAGPHIDAELYWGYAIWDVAVGERDVLQDHGVHFLLRARL